MQRQPDPTADAFPRARVLAAEVRDMDGRERAGRLEALAATDPELARLVGRMVEARRSDDSPILSAERLVAEAMAVIESDLMPSSISAANAAFESTTRFPDFGPRYRVLSELGRGSGGEVFLAQDLGSHGRRVALKLFPWSQRLAADRRRFVREGEALARLDHPAIARVHDVGSTPDGRPFFAMEFVDGTPIDQACGLFDTGTTERVRLVIRVCEAVQHAHQRGVIHRDLKPSNVLVARTDEGLRVKVIDFGIARLFGDVDQETITETGQVFGTPDYMAPEQRRGAALAETRSDVYAIGLLAHLLLLGRLPGRTDTAALRDDKAFAGRRRREFLAIVAMATEPAPNHRYATPMELADDLQRLLEDRPIRARRVTIVGRTIKAARRRPFAASLIATMIVVTAALAIGVIASRSQLARELDRQRTLTNHLLDDVLDRLYPVVGAGAPRRALTETLLEHVVALRQFDPDDLDLAEAHARLIGELGTLAYEARQYDTSLSLRRDAADRLGAIAGARPADLAAQRRHAEAIVRLGDSLLASGALIAAREQYWRAFSVHEALAAAHPDHVGVLDDFTWSHNRLFDDTDLAFDAERVEALLTRRLAIAERLLALDPDRLHSHYTLMESHHLLQRFHDLGGRRPEAFAAGLAAVEIGARLVAMDTQRLHFRLSYSMACITTARCAKESGDLELMRELIERADRITAQLLADEPDHVQAIVGRCNFADNAANLAEHPAVAASLRAEADLLLARLQAHSTPASR